MTKYVEARIGGGMIQEVAAVGPTAADEGYGPQQAANARLISAAPELLEFAVEWLSRQGDDDNYMTAKARAAIAKAKGEQA
jgi:hypothetical protein